MTKEQQLQKIVDRYQHAGQPWPAETKQIAAWAIQNKMWAPHPGQMIHQCAEELSRAMRDEYITDPQGRTVRAKHAARVEQGVFWDDIRTASRTHMQIAFQQRRQQIVGDCRQLKADVDSFNDNRDPLTPIQMSFNFTADVAELEALAV